MNALAFSAVDRATWTQCAGLIAPVLGKTRARKLIDKVWKIEQVADMRSLRPLLRAPRPLP